jgi:hypothetical protein
MIGQIFKGLANALNPVNIVKQVANTAMGAVQAMIQAPFSAAANVVQQAGASLAAPFNLMNFAQKM